jgi:hypothetical protein
MRWNLAASDYVALIVFAVLAFLISQPCMLLRLELVVCCTARMTICLSIELETEMLFDLYYSYLSVDPRDFLK